MGASRSRIPPWMFFCGFGRVCFLYKFTRSTIAVPLDGITRSTFACLPRSFPDSTRTVSPLRTWPLCGATSFTFRDPAYISDDLWCERNDLHELALAKLAGHRSEDARPHGLVLIVDEYCRVVVELDVRPVAAAMFLHRPDDDRLHDRALLDGAVGRGFLDRGRDDIADPGVLAGGRAAEHFDRRDFLRAGVVGHVQDCSHLNHDYLQCRVPRPACRNMPCGTRHLGTQHSVQLAFSNTSRTFQRFRFESGRVSSISTRSPTPRFGSSLCARNLFVRLMYF